MNDGDKLAMMLRHLASGGILQSAGSGVMYKLTPRGFCFRCAGENDWERSIFTINDLISHGLCIVPQAPAVEVTDTRQVEL